MSDQHLFVSLDDIYDCLQELTRELERAGSDPEVSEVAQKLGYLAIVLREYMKGASVDVQPLRDSGRIGPLLKAALAC